MPINSTDLERKEIPWTLLGRFRGSIVSWLLSDAFNPWSLFSQNNWNTGKKSKILHVSLFFFSAFLATSAVEPWYDKTNKMSVRPAKTQISLGICPVWSESSLCAQWVTKDPSFLHADSKDSDQTGRCQGWSESSLGAQPHCWFCHEVAQVFSNAFTSKLLLSCL